MAVLVTGATGFVGSWLVRELVRQGEDVHVLHRRNSDLKELGDLAFTSRLGDVTDPESVRGAVREVETVFHLAGVVAYSRTQRPEMERVNVEGTRHIISALNSTSKRLIYMSSVVAVGASRRPEVLDETSPFNVADLDLGYFATKRAAEELVLRGCREQNLQAIILNPSTIYGATDAKKGSRSTQVKVARGKFPFYTSGGVSIVSVHDVVAALLTARTKGRIGERYILSGENITIKKLFSEIAQLAGVPAPKIYLPNFVVHAMGALGEIKLRQGKKASVTRENAWTSTLYHWFDHAKAARELNFHPRPAHEALKESVDWMKQNGILK